MTITKEVADGAGSVVGTTETPAVPTAKSIKLTPAERYVVEDGSYLALAPKNSNFKAGDKVVAMNPDFDNQNGYTAADGDFGPDAPGLYVFRRSIKVDDNTQVETFKYDAYYFDGHDFYKVMNLKTTPSDVYKAGDADGNDGNLTGATYNLVKEQSETVVPTLKYEAAVTAGDNQHPQRLVATYDVGTANSALSTLAKTYDDACIAYQDALEKYEAALRGETSANGAVNTANTELQTALQNYRDALNDLQDFEDALKAAEDAKDLAAQEVTDATNNLNAKTTAYNNAMKDLYGYTNGGTTEQAEGKTDPDASANFYTNASLYRKYRTAHANTTAASSALGSPSDTKDDDTAYGRLALADYNLSLAEDDEEEAFEAVFNAYVNAHKDDAGETGSTGAHNVTTANDTPVTLSTVTYDQLVAMGLGSNTASPVYNYYELLVAKKEKEKELQTAKDNLAAKQTAEAEAQQNYNDGVAAVGTATTNKNNAQTRYNNAMKDLYGYTNGGVTTKADDKDDPDTSANCYKSGSKYGLYMKAQDDVDGQMRNLYGYSNGGTTDEYSGTEGTESADKYKPGDGSLYGKVKAAETAYNTAVNTTGTTASNNLNAARANLAAKTQAKQDAKEAYEKATNDDNPDANKLKININLSDDVTTEAAPSNADQWQLVTSALFDLYNNSTTAEYESGDAADNLTDTARFYYTGILGAGDTTSKLIDSVELDESVTNDMFKRFDFDLNVGLKSAQIAYNDAGNVTAEAANATLDANATNPDANGKVTWTTK